MFWWNFSVCEIKVVRKETKNKANILFKFTKINFQSYYAFTFSKILWVIYICKIPYGVVYRAFIFKKEVNENPIYILYLISFKNYIYACLVFSKNIQLKNSQHITCSPLIALNSFLSKQSLLMKFDYFSQSNIK